MEDVNAQQVSPGTRALALGLALLPLGLVSVVVALLLPNRDSALGRAWYADSLLRIGVALAVVGAVALVDGALKRRHASGFGS